MNGACYACTTVFCSTRLTVTVPPFETQGGNRSFLIYFPSIRPPRIIASQTPPTTQKVLRHTNKAYHLFRCKLTLTPPTKGHFWVSLPLPPTFRVPFSTIPPHQHQPGTKTPSHQRNNNDPISNCMYHGGINRTGIITAPSTRLTNRLVPKIDGLPPFHCPQPPHAAPAIDRRERARGIKGTPRRVSNYPPRSGDPRHRPHKNANPARPGPIMSTTRPSTPQPYPTTTKKTTKNNKKKEQHMNNTTTTQQQKQAGGGRHPPPTHQLLPRTLDQRTTRTHPLQHIHPRTRPRTRTLDQRTRPNHPRHRRRLPRTRRLRIRDRLHLPHPRNPPTTIHRNRLRPTSPRRLPRPQRSRRLPHRPNPTTGRNLTNHINLPKEKTTPHPTNHENNRRTTKNHHQHHYFFLFLTGDNESATKPCGTPLKAAPARLNPASGCAEYNGPAPPGNPNGPGEGEPYGRANPGRAGTPLPPLPPLPPSATTTPSQHRINQH